ncbi:hypothetical protein ACQR1W_39785, partial [Bradyrhizobium sp. HKCCYLS1011]|uniref:hypothetical protein n=1 Tax=Bradyrhizobium sp. HKCCYLS1011 TaxID=3420733 RepID=UPI003EC0FB74
MTDIALLRRELLQRRVAAAAEGRRVPRDIPRVARDVPLPLSHGQERLWFVEQLGLAGGTYN